MEKLPCRLRLLRQRSSDWTAMGALIGIGVVAAEVGLATFHRRDLIASWEPEKRARQAARTWGLQHEGNAAPGQRVVKGAGRRRRPAQGADAGRRSCQ